jgi:methenyltetrahydromethanopterin cyclohydrolase
MARQTMLPSVGHLSQPLVDRLIEDAGRYRVTVSRGPLGATLVDAGANSLGGIDAGLLIAEICMGGLGTVGLRAGRPEDDWPWAIQVRSSQPVIACLGSQYAGWSLKASEGGSTWQALGSGPVRAAARREPIFQEIGYEDHADRNVIVLETDISPPESVIAEVASAAGCAPDQLTVILTPTASLAGSVQIVARVLEVALHKAHTLQFPLRHIIDGAGVAPLAPPAPDFLTAMGRTNDAIIFGGQVHLYVTGADDRAKALAEHLPSAGSRDFGAPFSEIFQRFGGDFYAIDPMLFSPAVVIVTCVDSGHTHRNGRPAPEFLNASFA